MKNTIYIFLIFVLVFFLNLLLYIYVEDYRFIIKSLKHGADNSELSTSTIDDSYNVNSIELQKEKMRADLENGLLLDSTIGETDAVQQETIQAGAGVRKNEPNATQSIISEEESTGRVAQLTIVEKEVLDIFFENDFGLFKKLEKDDLLDIASEYPDDYFQYSRDSLDLYLLTTRTYREVSSIFSVLEFEMPFSLNNVNNFGSQSFFINLDNEDGKVRFIFEYKEKVFGVKVGRAEYETVRDILQKLQ